jgi:hypothetical protein
MASLPGIGSLYPLGLHAARGPSARRTGNFLVENTVASNPAGTDFIVTSTGSATRNTLRENTIALNACGLKGPVAGNSLTENVFRGNTFDSCP